MMASVKYHFGMLRTDRGHHSHQQECSTLHQDMDSTQFSLDEEEDGYSTILGRDYNRCPTTNNGQASRLLRAQNNGGDGGKISITASVNKQMANGAAKQRLINGHRNGGTNIMGNLHLERSRGPSRLRTSASKSSSLLTDEVELDDVEEEDELAAADHSGSDDEDDLLPTFSHLANGNGSSMASNGATLSLGQIGGPNGGNTNANGTLTSRLRRRLKMFGCCLPLKRAATNGFTQFK